MATTRREFVRLAGGAILAGLVRGPVPRARGEAPSVHVLYLEGEHFDELGGWEVDQQSMEQMGSPYLLAHGLGVPVKDAVTRAKVLAAGKYRVWVRTRDWVAPWKAPGRRGNSRCW